MLQTLEQFHLVSRRLGDDRLAREPKRLDRILVETRQRGYAIRDPGFVGGFYGTAPKDDGLAAIALPLLDRGRVHGAINILWVKTAHTLEDFILSS